MSHPTILVLGLMEEDYLTDLFEYLMSEMRKVATVKMATRAKEAKAILAAKPPPDGVLSIDAGPTESKHRALNEELVRYSRAGGTVVFGCNFSNHFSFVSAPIFFRAWGVPWTLGNYHRTVVHLNKDGVPGMNLTGLEPSYSVKALSLANVPRILAVYSPDLFSRTQSMVFPSTPVDTSETPAAYVAIGKGYVGYTGDVNAEEPTTKIIMAMLHLPIDNLGPDTRDRVVGVSFGPGGVREIRQSERNAHQAGAPSGASYNPFANTTTGFNGTASFSGSFDVNRDSDSESEASSDSMARGIPPRTPLTAPRPREAEVRVRAIRRIKATERRKVEAEKLKENGNIFFKAGNYEQAVSLYKQACQKYKPLPTYMSNLAAALIKLERWEEAEVLADHATLVEPNFMKGYFRRGVARIHCDKPDGAIRDFKRCLELDPSCKEAKIEIENVKKTKDKTRRGSKYEVDSDSDFNRVFDLGQDFVPGRTLHVLDCPSDSEEYHHKGKKGSRISCRYYNRGGCQFGKVCRYKHAPDDRSVRDELGRNFDKQCWYAHDKTYLPSNGWWNEDNLGGYQELYDKLKMNMEDGVLDRLGSIMNGTAMPWELTEIWLGVDEDSDGEMEERMANLGFTNEELNELLCQGVKPWDDDAWDVLNALKGHY